MAQIVMIFALIVITVITSSAFQPYGFRMRSSGRVSSLHLEMALKDTLSTDMKAAMKAKEKIKLGAIRAIQTAIKQIEVDEQKECTDDMAIGIMAKLVKSRRESVKSYTDAGRSELAEAEMEEINVIQSYMPAQMSQEEVNAAIADAIAEVGAASVKDMGKVMGILRPKLAGRADMSTVGESIKSMLK
jgi:uncharacterized protein YqeY